MLRYALYRLLQFIPTILGITLIVFFLMSYLPGNAALMAGGKRQLNEDTRALLEKKWGLDKPVYVRYLDYLGGLVQGDLGESFLRGENVSAVLGPRIWPTMKLAFSAIFIAILIGIPLGFWSALRQGSWVDTASMVGAVSGVSLPQFWLGLLLMYLFAVVIPVLPTSGYGDGSIRNLLLPAVTLGVGHAALLARTTRAAVVEVLNQDFIRTARAKGLPFFWINRRHIFRNTLVLILTSLGLQFGALIGETVVVEKVFSWPGLGSLMVDSIFLRDVPVTQGCVMIIIVGFLVINLTVDLLYAVIDPRIRYS